MKNYPLALFLIIINTILLGQNQNWFFGYNAGLSFNAIPPSPIANGQLLSYEGGSGMSDRRGESIVL